MKKYFCLTVFLSLLFIGNGTAQPKKNNKGNDNAITISVKGIEYDNPDFENLRNAIKGNMKVKQSSPGFTGDIARITLSYPGTAPELWDEMPQTCRQSFKITSIDDNRIELQLKSKTAVSSSSATETKKDDCIDCYYFKSCSFDTSAVFDGNTYKGYKKKGSFYFCKNNVFYNKSVYNNKVYSQVVFKANAPVGTNWTDTFGTDIINKTIVSKGFNMTYGKTYYDDALVVYFSDISLTALYYYVKGSGYIKLDSLDKSFNPAIAAKMKGNVDTALVGTWKNYNEINRTTYYYKFNGDGTFAYYSGSISKDNQMPSGVSLWRVNDNYIELYNGAWKEVSQVPYKKKNDPGSGKPAIAFGSGNNMIYFVSSDSKPAWKQ